MIDKYFWNTTSINNGYKVPREITNAIMQSIILFNKMYPLIFFFFVVAICNFLKLRAYNNKAEPEIKNIEIRIKNPLFESWAKEWTDAIVPDLTINVPIITNVKVNILSNIVQFSWYVDFLGNFIAWINAVEVIHGIREAFSTGSQNQNPPQPNSLYAHHAPEPIPTVKKLQASSIHGFIDWIH